MYYFVMMGSRAAKFWLGFRAPAGNSFQFGIARRAFPWGDVNIKIGKIVPRTNKETLSPGLNLCSVQNPNTTVQVFIMPNRSCTQAKVISLLSILPKHLLALWWIDLLFDFPAAAPLALLPSQKALC